MSIGLTLINNTIDSLDNEIGKLELFDNFDYSEMIISVLQSYIDTEKSYLSDNEIEYFDIWIKTYNTLKYFETDCKFSLYEVYMDCKKDIEYSKQYKKKGVA